MACLELDAKVYPVYLGVMTEGPSDTVISFKVPEGVAKRLETLGERAPRISGARAPSRHQVARSLVLDTLKAHELILAAKSDKEKEEET